MCDSERTVARARVLVPWGTRASVCARAGTIERRKPGAAQREVAGHGMSHVDHPAKHARSGGQWPRHKSERGAMVPLGISASDAGRRALTRQPKGRPSRQRDVTLVQGECSIVQGATGKGIRIGNQGSR